ncbi:MAG TPA: HD domain-containing phosphohydrolase [Gemmataceae bacterium]|nr:HD domain-containing phosphohydrolase [Gemmataceae bacterium]
MPFTQRHRTIAVTVVDDEPAAQDVLARAAALWDYPCQIASSAEQALELLERCLTPIVVTDLRMPGRGGLWLVREIRRRWPEVGIIVLTAGHNSEDAQECLRAGAHHYFFKPIKLDELRHVLETTWQSYHRQREDQRVHDALQRAVRRQTRRVRRTFLSAIASLVRTVEERDPYTAGHARRVRAYALQLAAALGLDRRRRQVGLAAMLHDIGKVGIPDAILHKPDRLNPEEDRIIRGHPEVGERILAPIVRSAAVLAAIRGHHERLDGRGYPDGLQGEQIPLLARVIAIPDCYDALTTSRAYRSALPKEEALAILEAGAGSHFDPALVRTFLRIAPELMK